MGDEVGGLAERLVAVGAFVGLLAWGVEKENIIYKCFLFRECLVWFGNHCIGCLRRQYQKIPTPSVQKLNTRVSFRSCALEMPIL